MTQRFANASEVKPKFGNLSIISRLHRSKLEQDNCESLFVVLDEGIEPKSIDYEADALY